MTISKDIIQLHDEIINLSSEVQAKSSAKINEEHHIEDNVYAVFYKVVAFATTLHRATKSLCESGWTHITPVLLRALLECTANCLAVINNELPEYMAFKYLYHPYVKTLRDNKFSEDIRKKAERYIEQGVNNLKNPRAIEKAKQFISEKRPKIFWFKPEEDGVSAIINKYGDSELKFTYQSLSMSTHAGHFGLFFFKDDSDDIDINPCENPEKTKGAILFSCRYLLELIYIRNAYENLGFDSDYSKLIEKILAFKPKDKS